MAPHLRPTVCRKRRLGRCRITYPTVRAARLAHRPLLSVADRRRRRTRLGIAAQSAWAKRGRGVYLCVPTWSVKDGDLSRIYNFYPLSYFLDPTRVSVAASQTTQEDAPLSVVCRGVYHRNNLHTYLLQGRIYFAPKNAPNVAARMPISRNVAQFPCAVYGGG